MTRPQDHTDLDELARVESGEVDGARAAEVHDHLARCAACRSLAAHLRAVDRGLAALRSQGAGPMPAVAAAQLSDALRSAGRTPAGPSRMPRGARWAGLAAAAAVVALVTGIVISHARSGPPAVGANASAGTAIHEVPLGVTPDAVQVHSLQAVERASGTNYTARSVARVSPPDSRSPSSGSGSGGVAAGDSVPQGLSDLVSPQQMFSCISQLTTVPVVTVPLAVDFARYRGSPAAVVVLAEDATHDQVYVVGPRCGLPGAEGDLLLYQQLARH